MPATEVPGDLSSWPSTGQAARILGLSEARVRQLDAAGELRSIRTATGRLFDPADLERLRIARQAAQTGGRP